MNERREDMFDIMFRNPKTTMEQASNIVERRRGSRWRGWMAIVVVLLIAACLAQVFLG